MIQDKVSLIQRPRRLRATAALRDLVAQTYLRPEDLIMPYFVVSGTNVTEPIGSLPGVARLSPDLLLRDLERGLKLGVRAAMLFGVVPAEHKDANGVHAHDPSGPRRSGFTRCSPRFRQRPRIAERRVFMWVHRPRTLRPPAPNAARRRDRQRRQPRGFGRNGAAAR